MRSGSTMPLFSRTIFFWRWKKGTSVGHNKPSTGVPSRLPTIAVASAAVTFLYRTPESVETSGPSEHSPMHPTPLDWQVFSKPRPAISLSIASFTDCDWQETQPAATQTFTRRVYCLRAASSVSTISSNSSGVMRHPFHDLIAQGLTAYLAGNLIVIHHRWGKATGSQATRRKQRDFAIRGRLPRGNSQVALHGGQQLRRSLDVTSRAHAHHASVFACRLEGEKVIEGSHAEGTAQRHSKRRRNITQSLHIQIPKDL